MIGSNPRKGVPFVILLVAGVVTTIDYFVTYPDLQRVSTVLQTWSAIIAAFALGVGTINLLVIHGRRLAKRSPEYSNDVVLLIGLFGTILLGLWLTTNHPAYQFLYFNVLVQSDTAMWSLLAFYIVSAGIRTMRARTKEGAVLLITGILVLIRNTPAMGVLWGGFIQIGDWLLNVANVGASRGIVIASAIGIVALGLRILLGQERTMRGG